MSYQFKPRLLSHLLADAVQVIMAQSFNNNLENFCVLQRVKERKTYTDVDIDDDEIEGKRNYALDENLRSQKYNKGFVQQLKGEGRCLSV